MPKQQLHYVKDYDEAQKVLVSWAFPPHLPEFGTNTPLIRREFADGRTLVIVIGQVDPRYRDE